MAESQLRLFSIGIVSEDKKVGSDSIRVTPTEHVTMGNGPINTQSAVHSVSAPDSTGKITDSKATSEGSLIAKWLPFGQSNRITSPDVYAGETVILFTFSDTNEYYWTTIFREPKLRRLETVMYGLSNLKDKIAAFTRATSYWWEWSTRDKYVKLHTSKNDGEPFEYDFTLDTHAGKLTITDDTGNSIVLDSKESTVTLNALKSVHLKSNTEITLESPKVNVAGVLSVNNVQLEVP
jgi:hypothetical protein